MLSDRTLRDRILADIETCEEVAQRTKDKDTFELARVVKFLLARELGNRSASQRGVRR